MERSGVSDRLDGTFVGDAGWRELERLGRALVRALWLRRPVAVRLVVRWHELKHGARRPPRVAVRPGNTSKTPLPAAHTFGNFVTMAAMGQRWAFALAVVTSMAQACGSDDSEPGGTSSGGTSGSGGQGGDASVVFRLGCQPRKLRRHLPRPGLVADLRRHSLRRERRRSARRRGGRGRHLEHQRRQVQGRAQRVVGPEPAGLHPAGLGDARADHPQDRPVRRRG